MRPAFARADAGLCRRRPACLVLHHGRRQIPAAAGGLPADVPERPQTTPAYPAVHDMPPARNTAVLTEEEKKRVEAELAIMREQQAKRAQSSAANPN